MTRVTLEENCGLTYSSDETNQPKRAENADAGDRRETRNQYHRRRSNREAKNRESQRAARSSDAIANVSLRDLEEAIAPTRMSQKTAPMLMVLKEKLFLDIFARNTEIEAIERGDGHDGHYDAHHDPANAGGPAANCGLGRAAALFLVNVRLWLPP